MNIKKGKQFFVIVWLNMVGLSLFMVFGSGTGITEYEDWDKESLVQEIETTSGVIIFRLYKGDENIVTSQYGSRKETIIYYGKNSTVPDSLVLTGSHLKIYADEEVFRSVKLSKILPREVKPMAFVNDVPITSIGKSWFSMTRIFGLLALAGCAFFFYIYYVEVLKK